MWVAVPNCKMLHCKLTIPAVLVDCLPLVDNPTAPAFVRLWTILLQKSPSEGCGIEICNNRIEAGFLLNLCCAFLRDLESMLRAGMQKILLQQYRTKADIAAAPPNVCFRGAGSTGRRNTCVALTKRLLNCFQDPWPPAIPKLCILGGSEPSTTSFAYQHTLSIFSVHDRCCVDRLRLPG